MKVRAKQLESQVVILAISLGIVLISGNQFQYGLVNAKENPFILIHGGGTGRLVCPDGSSVQSDVSFVLTAINDTKVSGNWTLNDFADPYLSGSVFVEGQIYNGSASIYHYNVTGETHNIKEKIMLCDPPLFAPISIVGECGNNVYINVALKTDELFDIEDPFYGDVICQPHT